MSTSGTRAELARESLSYASSLTNAEWALIAPFLSDPSSTGRPWRWPLRAILDGILYVLHTCCAWRHLPLDFPPRFTVHRWLLRLSTSGMFERLAHALTLADRERTGREASPTSALNLGLPRFCGRSGDLAEQDLEWQF